MANLPDLDDDHARVGRRQSEATATGGQAYRPATASHRDPGTTGCSSPSQTCCT